LNVYASVIIIIPDTIAAEAQGSAAVYAPFGTWRLAMTPLLALQNLTSPVYVSTQEELQIVFDNVAAWPTGRLAIVSTAPQIVLTGPLQLPTGFPNAKFALYHQVGQGKAQPLRIECNPKAGSAFLLK
jgi:hypothetical protein